MADWKNPFQLTFEQVEGHKDNKTSESNLSIMEKMNVECDTDAKKKLLNTYIGIINPKNIPFKGFVCYAGKQK